MRVDYPKIKKFLQIGVFSFNLLIYLLVLFTTNSKNKNYKEYTGASKFFLGFYILVINSFLIVITIFPAMLYMRMKSYFLFAFEDKGKIILSYSMCLVYWFARNKPQLVYGILSTITTTILLLYEFIFYFQKVENFINSKGIEFINRKKTTMDMSNLEKSINNNIGHSSNPNANNSSGQNNANNQQQQIVDVVSGYE